MDWSCGLGLEKGITFHLKIKHFLEILHSASQLDGLFARTDTWKMEIFRPKRDEVKRGSRKLHNLSYSPNVTKVIKHRRNAWAGMWNVWKRTEMYVGFWWEKLEERIHLEFRNVDADNIKINLEEMWWDCAQLTHLAENKDKWRVLLRWKWAFGLQNKGELLD